jgi:hypothetical protein
VQDVRLESLLCEGPEASAVLPDDHSLLNNERGRNRTLGAFIEPWQHGGEAGVIWNAGWSHGGENQVPADL